MSSGPQRVAVVLGARNLGGVVARDLLAAGWQVASVARTRESLEVVERAGALAIAADAADPVGLESTLTRVAAELGPLDLVVNAVSAAQPPGDGKGFGGGAIADASAAGLEDWTLPSLRQAFAFLSSGCRALANRGGTLVQVLGSPARRADAGRGLLAAGQAGVRALVHATAQEQRASGIHVALVIVDGIIASPKTAQMAGVRPETALVRQEDVAEAVRYLAGQSARGMSHELVVSAAGDRWVP
jgi:NAD(P)-dependent dehydrogenase (short-subunit alcohol dehydrogenase family)